VIRVKQTAINNKKIWFNSTKFWITNHLGKNPKNGGNPPKDNKFRNMKNLIEGFIIERLKIWLKWNNLKLLNIKTIDIDNNE